MIIAATDSTTLSIQTKNTADATILWRARPSKEKGGRMKSPDVALHSVQHETSKFLEQSTIVIDHAGEYETKGVFIVGIDAVNQPSGSAVIFAVDLEGMRALLIPGSISGILTQEQRSLIGSVDMIMIASEAASALLLADIITEIEPRAILITESAFSQTVIKKIGLQPEQIQKLKLSKKDLPQEHTICYLLTSE